MSEQSVCQIDTFGPVPLYRPATVGALGELVRQFGAEDQAIYPVGGRTMLGLGMPPTKPGVAVDTRSLIAVIDYPARDMTVTVEAGTTITALRTLLRTENQQLPIDVPEPDVATIGGVLAVNVSGPRRYGYGTLRDYVLGMTVVNDSGKETKSGGRVVKNVAGYDLPKLYVGSLGTLGVITQVTLKLKPIPEARALVSIGCEPVALEPLLTLLHNSRTRPVCLELLNADAAEYLGRGLETLLPESPWTVVVGFEESRRAVEWQLTQLAEELTLQPGLAVETIRGLESEPLWLALTEQPARPDALAVFKANMLPRSVAGFCRRAESLWPGLSMQARAGNGIIIGQVVGNYSAERAAGMLDQLLPLAVELQGNLVLTKCPPAWRSTIPVWGAARGDAWLMRAVKERLDPRNLFNPGRFAAGI